jgi:predicted phage terminase large subunit-like protein
VQLQSKGSGPVVQLHLPAPLPWQDDYFKDPARFKVLAKGRRVGGTTGAVYHLIEKMLSGKLLVLWCDTTQSNLSTYWQRLWLPVLSKLPKLWSWNESKKVLHLGHSTCDFRSAERPENLEGFAYDVAVLNEAGLILRDRTLWEISIRPMIVDRQAPVLFIGTPKGRLGKDGKDCLYYELYQRGLDPVNWPAWKSWRIPSTANPTLSGAELQAMANEIPAANRAQEMDPHPITLSLESIIRESWIDYVDEIPPEASVMRRILSVDTAFKTTSSADYSAATEWIQTYNGHYYCTDAWQDRLTFPALISKITKLYELKHFDALLVEDCASGQSLIQMLQRAALPVTAYKPGSDKLTRLASASTKIEAGTVHFIRAPWNKELIGQLTLYPQVEHDDLVDTVSQALLYMNPSVLQDARAIVSRRVIHDQGEFHNALSTYQHTWS